MAIAPLLRKATKRIPGGLVQRLVNLWPPFLGAGIKIKHISNDYRYAKVTLVKRWYNLNYVGTQFGGSIYAMTDPFLMLMLINNLGPDYVVWDKAAEIEFLKPGRTKLTVEFRVTDEMLSKVRSETVGCNEIPSGF